MPMPKLLLSATAAVSLAAISHVWAHGDVAPQPVNTDALPDIGEEWLPENPYRDPNSDAWQAAIEIGASGYNQNCARCHGLEVISGGLAPDLRYLEADDFGDEWYVERFRHGYTQNGITKMPAFGELLGQKAAWAIRTYIEARPDEGALDEFNDRLKAIRDELAKMAEAGASDSAAVQGLKDELTDIATKVETGSGAVIADSVAFRAAKMLEGDAVDVGAAAETLTVGLSVAQ